jgi:hypothetical protein
VTSADDSARTIVEKLQAAGVRATTDAGALNPPAILVIPVPRRVADVACGYTATFTLHAIGVGPTGSGTAEVGKSVNELVDAVMGVFPITDAVPGAYVLPNNRTHPSSTILITEVISL